MLLRNYCLKLSRNMSNCIATKNRPSNLSTKFVSQFQDFYPKLIDKGLSQIKYLPTADFTARLKQVSTYYTMEKVPLQGELVVYAYELLEKPENINDKMQHQLFTVAALIETMQAYFYIIDDIFDNGKTRCGKPCWHMLPDIQSFAMYDANILRGFTKYVIKQNIDKKFCSNVLNIFDETYFITEVGQYLDEALVKTKNYTREYYNILQHYKASRYALVSDLLLAATLANKLNEESRHCVEDLCNDLGVMIQVHNDLTDYLDTDEKIAKKSSVDIQNGNCTWLAVTAMEKCNPAQRKIFEKCYGSRDPEDMNRIRQLYVDLDVFKLFELEKQMHYDIYLRKAHNLPKDAVLSTDFFIKILDFFDSYMKETSRYYYI